MTSIKEQQLHCPICSSSHTRVIKTRSIGNTVFSVMQCRNANCLHGFLTPLPSPDQLSQMYADENLNTYLTEEAEIRRALDFFAHIFERYLPQAFTEPGSLLDLGAGIGTLVYTARKFNWKAIGVELNRRSVDWAAERFGIELIQGDFYRLEEYFTRKSFDLISLNHVLEHVLQPRFFINYIADFLKPRGAILVSVPNILSDDFRRDGALWSYIHIPGHISYFSHFSMDALFLSGTQRPSPRFKKIFQTSFPSPSQHEGEGLTSLYQDTSHTSSASQ